MVQSIVQLRSVQRGRIGAQPSRVDRIFRRSRGGLVERQAARMRRRIPVEFRIRPGSRGEGTVQSIVPVRGGERG